SRLAFRCHAGPQGGARVQGRQGGTFGEHTVTSRPHHGTLLRFVLVGGGLAVLYATLAALATSQLPLPKALSSALVWLICIPVGFWCHRRFTFTGRTAHRHGLWLYAVTQLLGIGIASAVGYFMATGVFRHDLPVHLFASGLAAVTSYALNHRFTFPHA
ncbi:MAG: GtrA family protein, partial [Acetobacteraceae bacterium]